MSESKLVSVSVFEFSFIPFLISSLLWLYIKWLLAPLNVYFICRSFSLKFLLLLISFSFLVKEKLRHNCLPSIKLLSIIFYTVCCAIVEHFLPCIRDRVITVIYTCPLYRIDSSLFTRWLATWFFSIIAFYTCQCPVSAAVVLTSLSHFIWTKARLLSCSGLFGIIDLYGFRLTWLYGLYTSYRHK